MSGWFDFAAWQWGGWWFPLLAAPGLWLGARLYLKGPSRHRGPAVLYAAAWLLLAAWAVSPMWRSRPEIWHPPLVILAVDESSGFAALGARDSGRAVRQAARRHYEALGFRVLESGFLDRVPGGGAEHPNLQAVLVWSDARGAALEGDVSAPAFPVPTEVSTGEVQGESAFVAASDEGDREAVRLVVAWRALGRVPAAARAELRAGDDVVWAGTLEHPPAGRAGERVTSVIPLSPGVRESAGREGVRLVLLVRPRAARDNVIAANDTVAVDASRLHRALQAFVRPVSTLQERGLMDALREEPTFRVAAVAPTRARAAAGRTVIWVAAGREASVKNAVASSAEPGDVSPVIIRHLASSAAAGGDGTFDSEARIERLPGVAPFLPAGVLRLADLGFAEAVHERAGAWRLPPADEDLEALAWAVQEGRRGLLFWRDRARGTYGFVVPPIWDVRFRPGAATAAASLASAWARGAAAVALANHVPHAPAPATGSLPPSSDAGNRRIRLGTDTEALSRFAARTGGRVLAVPPSGVHEGGGEVAWPALPGGQIRETRARALTLAPSLPAALAVTLLLAGVWAWRRRRQLD